MIDQIKATVDIVELISQDENLDGNLRSGHLSKHSSKSGTPLHVHPETQSWYCWSCKIGGSIIDWIVSRDECSVSEAVKTLATAYGISDDGSYNPEIQQRRQSVRGIMKEGFEWYHEQLTDEHRNHLIDRGLTTETIDKLKIGYAPPGGDALRGFFMKKGYDSADLLATGFFHHGKTRAYDSYQDRLVFPYWFRDEPVYSIGRLPPDADLDDRHESDRGKYKKHLLHSEKRPYILKDAVQHVIYGQNSLHGKSEIILTEGVVDAILAHQAGYACLSPVTVRFQAKDTPELVRLCKKADTVFIINDNEDTDRGAHGALDTAAALFESGQDVRIVDLPKPQDVDKIDLADFLSSGGNLDEVLETGVSYLQTQIDNIASMNGRKRTVAATGLLQALKDLEPLECESGLELMAAAGIGKIGILRKQMKTASTPIEIEVDPDTRSHRRVSEKTDYYAAYNPESQAVDVISNFILVPSLRVVIEDKESIVVDFVGKSKTVAGIIIDRAAFNDKLKFMNQIPSVDFWFDGSLSHIQSILAIVSEYDIPTKIGTDKVGLDPSGVWVLPAGGITKHGFKSDTEIAYTPTGGVSEWSQFLKCNETGFDAIRQSVADLLPQINEDWISWAAIGWFAATPFKPQLTSKHGGFPFLNVTGTRGSGKSSMLRIFARLFGYAENSVLFSCDQTPFVLLRLLSSSVTVPIILDEYKYDMDVKKRELLVRYIRRTYNGEAEFRGNADKTLSKYTLTAPVVLAGEIDITESAMIERMIHLPVEPASLTEQAKKAHAILRDLPLNAFALPYIHSTLQSSFDARYGKLLTTFEDFIPSCADRIRDNLKTMLFGICQFLDFLGLEHKPEIFIPAVKGARQALTQSADRAKVGFDTFVEHLATLAEIGRLQDGIHFLKKEDYIALRFNSCFAEFRKFARETSLDDEILSANAYRRQARENQFGYVLDTAKNVRFDDSQVKRCLVIAVDQAIEAGIDIDGFNTIQNPVI